MSVFESCVAIICAVFASSGFWMWLQAKREKKSSSTKLMLGIAHNDIITLGMRYIERGYIYKYEYDTLLSCLYNPYVALGGDGMCSKIIDDVRKLPLRSPSEGDKDET